MPTIKYVCNDCNISYKTNNQAKDCEDKHKKRKTVQLELERAFYREEEIVPHEIQISNKVEGCPLELITYVRMDK